ncbi:MULTISPECIES: small ribosomal subunit biogenesis GTPase RsgA [Pseudomonas]|jgi:ribosome biogenesis GTPase|uniref:Small ribosomal subunit biogenesis GTPase RsgA n=1 Tax=Pseudomonas umsongensis TaxID=198618 RepID=A0AAE6ZR52_9PSED|nr:MULTISPECIES: small ribosomal subunit biogenesis GTPase RsgA [Pseudomonas]EPA95763.1 ribosome small subunit-dependent GTPase A [Pseudomonas sp. G5(2012)]MBT9573433.1 small ribosomal subunit biogenesis GTPase RsgA [Pseudomonas umsongensis]OXR30496.1 ribosome small subunit-dependent GTPase [Pseudomonas umsongensis]QJC77275.1 small ribosomal subunit biogenesis GTPase RsgA [Pseudomonas umsongensis]SDT76092.1 ribosome biogenesis GTPase [Pseudomonas umsongensis]
MAKRQLNRRQNWRIEKIQGERAARAAKRESSAVEALEGGDLGPEQHGLVIAHFGVQVEVEARNGALAGQVFRCHLRANLPALVTGDQVVWRAGNQGIGVIVAQLPRNTELCRPDSRGQLKPVAANVDMIVIVFAPLPEPHANLIDRYLVAAEHAGIKPLLLLNKFDLIDEHNAPALNALLAVYRTLGYPVLEVSAHHGDGMEQLQKQLDGRISVFVGQSGVGKSSLVNSLLPEVETRVGPLSELSGQGTHTTTTARLFHFPGGGELIDSPGIREFGLGHVSRADVEAGFIEFNDLLGTCRFRDCKHDREPGCALLKALEDGRVQQQRMNSYRSIIASLPENGY